MTLPGVTTLTQLASGFFILGFVLIYKFGWRKKPFRSSSAHAFHSLYNLDPKQALVGTPGRFGTFDSQRYFERSSRPFGKMEVMVAWLRRGGSLSCAARSFYLF